MLNNIKAVYVCFWVAVFLSCMHHAAYAFTEYDHSAYDHPVGQWEMDDDGQLDYDPDANPAETPSVYKSDDSYPTTENYYRGAEYDYEGHQEPVAPISGW